MDLVHHRSGAGPTLVLLHGIGSRWGVWEPVIAPLSRRFDVIAPDLPGFGASPMPPPGTAPGVASLCDLLLGFLREQQVAQFHACGNSLGGLLALELGRRGEALSVCGLSPAGFANRLETAVTRATLQGAIRGARLMAGHAGAVTSRPGARRLLNRAFFAHPERQPARAAAQDMRAFAAAPWFDATLAAIQHAAFEGGAALSLPVTIAWGDHDRILPPRQAARAQALIPQARVLALPDCGHLPTWDDPALVAQVIAEAAGA